MLRRNWAECSDEFDLYSPNRAEWSRRQRDFMAVVKASTRFHGSGQGVNAISWQWSRRLRDFMAMVKAST
jgi:hypothetical protein